MNTSNKGEWLVLLGLLTLVGLAVWYVNPVQLRFKPVTESDILALVGSLLVLAIFVERANESILVPLRTPDRQAIEQAIEDAGKLPDSTQRATQVRKLEVSLQQYRLGTAKRAYWLSLLMGLLISTVGLRILGSLVEIPQNAPTWSSSQQHWLTFVDIVLTGCVISGGSAAIDKIGRRLSGMYNLSSATTQLAGTARTAEDPSKDKNPGGTP